MECFHCRHDNPPEARLCEECGAELERLCPQCHEAVAQSAKFCQACGQDLAPHTPLFQSSSPAPSSPAGERRQATVVFSDLSGYTAMNVELDPEEVELIMSRIKKSAVEIVERHGGIVNQFVGDEVLALFGIPVAHEDDPHRAVRASLELHALVRRISPEVERRIGRPIRMHTGIDTGLVVTHLQDERDGLFGITGNTVNTAARLAAISEPDDVLITSAMKRRVSPYFATQALDPVALKGLPGSAAPFRVQGESRLQTRLEAAEQRGLTAYTGRERELEALHHCLEKAMAGEGQIATVVGDAGAGKSRLLYEFRHSLDRESLTVLEGRCQSYGTEIGYVPLIDALKRGLHLHDGDSPAALHEKVVTNVRAIDPELERHVPVCLHLLSIPSKTHPLPLHLQGPELRSAIQEALAEILTRNAQHQPLVLILEDWHWADEASDQAMKRLLATAAAHPLLVAVLYRPEYAADWSHAVNHTSITLPPLDARHSEELIKAAWRADSLPDGLAPLIRERTGGNPFFIEEVCGSLVVDSLVQIHDGQATLTQPLQHVAIPATVEAVIRTKLDRLGPDQQETLRLASVIGREFTGHILKRVSPPGPTLAKVLSTLQAQDLIQRIQREPEEVYMFKHVLTREVAYETLLLKRRKELHALVAQAMEALYAGRIEEKVEVLAQHYSLAEDWPRAVHYGRLSADKSHRLGHYQQAVQHYRTTIDWLLRLPEERARQEQLVDLYTDAGWVLLPLGQAGQLAEMCQEIEPVARALEDRVRLGKVNIANFLSCMFGGRTEDAEPYILRAIELLEGTGEENAVSWSRHALGISYLARGLWLEAEPLLSDALATYEKHRLQTSYVFGLGGLPYVWGCAHLGYNLAVKGRTDEALATFSKGVVPALDLASNFQTRLGYTSWLALYCALAREEPLDAQARVRQLWQAAEGTGSPFVRLQLIVIESNMHMAREDFEGARACCQQAIKALGGTVVRTGHLPNLYYNLAQSCLELGDHAAARRAYQEGLPLVEIAPAWYEPRFEFLCAQLQASGDEPRLELVEACFTRAVAGDEQFGAVVPAAQSRYYLARVLRQSGDEDRARDMLTRLSRQFAQCGMSTWSRKCDLELEAS